LIQHDLAVHVADFTRPKLSICIATYNRSKYIVHTIRAILDGLPNGVEVVIVDGASQDDTEQVVAPFVRSNEAIRYFREARNSGVDRDFDKAVGYARGAHCWLMSDDDILIPGAVARVLDELESPVDLLVVNSQIRTVDLSAELSPRILEITSDRYYDAESRDSFLGDVGDYLSFIGGVVIRRDIWLERERERYFGSLFIHVGVIFQAPLSRIKVLAEPLILIRLGNAMWTSRGFEIWMFKWPDLIWSFDDLAPSAKLRVVAREPWRLWRRLVFYRAIGAYSYADYRKLFADKKRGGLLQATVSLIPAVFANGLTALYWLLANRKARPGIYDLARCSNASRLTRCIARMLDIPTR
jgi:glycosyltransferase involved in cell wall biosynthesis